MIPFPMPPDPDLSFGAAVPLGPFLPANLVCASMEIESIGLPFHAGGAAMV
jgi:hypothetical protein